MGSRCAARLGVWVLALMAVGCVEGPPEVEVGSLTASEEVAVCGGSCDEIVFDACTCAQDDPCGWRADGFCDEDPCKRIVAAPFEDDEDCTVDCTVTMCLTGAVNQHSGSNSRFAEICESPQVEGLIPDCDTSPCLSTHDSFFKNPRKVVYPDLFDALDTNGDGSVNDLDQRCEVNLIGYSWGGVNAVRVAQALIDDPNVSATRSWIDRLLLIDPYQPWAGSWMNIPSRVRRTRAYRHSTSPEGDCSEWSPLGPYRGLPPRCREGADCIDYDFALAPNTWFPVPEGGGIYGDDVGHCGIVMVAHDPILSELSDTPHTGPLPPTAAPTRP